ncbi:hypothetical protein XHC_3012 [Xanthomonas hortorum pv. carotae str. M081]|nr:hypothetical protein XHC_3012 [Xanthomonas hortorum pv. carotae str. M081]
MATCLDTKTLQWVCQRTRCPGPQLYGIQERCTNL